MNRPERVTVVQEQRAEIAVADELREIEPVVGTALAICRRVSPNQGQDPAERLIAEHPACLVMETLAEAAVAGRVKSQQEPRHGAVAQQVKVDALAKKLPKPLQHRGDETRPVVTSCLALGAEQGDILRRQACARFAAPLPWVSTS